MAVTAPQSHEDAAKQLEAAKIEFDVILRDDGEAVLFVRARRAFTAWRDKHKNGSIVFYVQSGFAAFPHAYVKNEAE